MSADGSRARDQQERDLQFDVVEPASPGAPATHSPAASSPRAQPAPGTCANCRGAITTAYYEVQGLTVCPRCRARLQQDPAGSGPGRFLRALGLGLAAAIGGSVLYFAIAAATGYELAIVAIAVGYLVGLAVRKGSGGRGGRKYQWLALGLTYFAIVSTYIPLAMREMGKSPAAHGSSHFSVRQAGTGAGLASADSAAPSRAGAADTTVAPVRHHSAGFTVAAVIIGALVLLGIAAIAPFLAGASNIIGLVIIGVALWQAWKMNRRVVLRITGPYRVGEGASRGPAAGGIA